MAIQGRVSQNLRLIQVIFGHTASEAKGVCVCVCLSVCVRKRVRVSVCVQTRSRPNVPENSTAKAKMLSFFTPGTDPKVSTTFQSKSGGDGVLFEKKRRSKELPEDETFSCRNGRWKEPWKVEGRRV